MGCDLCICSRTQIYIFIYIYIYIYIYILYSQCNLTIDTIGYLFYILEIRVISILICTDAFVMLFRS